LLLAGRLCDTGVQAVMPDRKTTVEKPTHMIHVIATIELQPGRREDFLAEFHKIVPAVRAEAGCIEYGPAVDADTDIAAQQRKGADVVTVVEKWESLDALKAHLVAPHMQEYRPRVKELVRQSTLHVLKPA
jgi:quinol monooxygenase YgiN